MEVGVDVEFAGGEQVAGERGVAGGDVAETVVFVVFTQDAIILDEIADRAEIIDECPEHAVGAVDELGYVFLRQDLIYGFAVQVATFEVESCGAISIGVDKIENHIPAGGGGDAAGVVENVTFDGGVGQCEGGGCVDRFADAAIENVVRVGDDFGRRALGVFFGDLGQMIAIIPIVFGGFERGVVGAGEAVAFVVICAGKSSVIGELIIAAGGVAGVGAVAVGVVRKRLIGLKTVYGVGELVGGVVAVIAGSILAGELRDAVQRVVLPGVGREQIRPAFLVVQPGQAGLRIVRIIRRGDFIRTAARRIIKPRDRRKPPAAVQAEIDPFLGHRIPAALADLIDPR